MVEIEESDDSSRNHSHHHQSEAIGSNKSHNNGNEDAFNTHSNAAAAKAPLKTTAAATTIGEEPRAEAPKEGLAEKPWVAPIREEVEQNPFLPEAHGFQPLDGTPYPLPLEKPPFTLKQVRDAIPPHCFERSTLKSLLYTVHNVGMCLALFYASTWIEHLPLPSAVQWVLWPAYWFVQGAYMFGLWILAHECGHEAYSDSPLLNDAVGLILHSFVLVPFHSWKYSHRKHHMNTGSAENEEVFVPRTRTEMTPIWIEILEESPIFNLLRLILILFTGLLPLYLVFNFGGPVKYQGKNANHFSPSSIMFLPKQRKEIVISDIVYFSWVGLVIYFCWEYGCGNVFFYYGGPQLITNYHLVLITYLQHTDTFVPHFRGEDWYWLRGALCTVDRSFGPWLDGVFHHISDTHVCHHLFPKLPFYHAQEATEAISGVLGKYRMVDETPMWLALWRAYRNCKFVEDDGPVCFYKKSLNAPVDQSTAATTTTTAATAETTTKSKSL